MGWANCGTDSEGRPIGYAHQATCDHPGCTAIIDRGLAYACGGDHLADGVSCEGYFCDAHRQGWVKDERGEERMVCADCAARWREEHPHVLGGA